MIETRIDQMLSLVRDGKILSDKAFASVSLANALEIRDRDYQFRYYYDNDIRSRWDILPIHPDIRGAFDELHSLTYIIAKERIRKFTDATDDTTYLLLPDRINQEVDCIAMSRGTQFHSDWYDQLWESYMRDEFR